MYKLVLHRKKFNHTILALIKPKRLKIQEKHFALLLHTY